MSRAAQLRSDVSYAPPSSLGVTVDDDLTDREPMSADDLESALHVQAMRDPSWMIDAVVEACVNGDLLFLQRQVERHVPGWVAA